MKNTVVRYGTRLTSPLSDPTVLFAIAISFGPLLFSYEKIDTIQRVYHYFTEPSWVTVISCFIICEWFPKILSFFDVFGLPVKDNSVESKRGNSGHRRRGHNNNHNNNNNNNNHRAGEKLSMSTQQFRIARWYLVNGLFFHTLCDSIAGTHQQWSLMSEAYKELDARFYEPTSAEGMLASLVTQLEMFVMTPLCLLVYYGYRCHALKQPIGNNNKYIVKHEAWVYIAEIITSTLQLIGCYFFYGGEIAHVMLDTGHWKTPFDVNLEFTPKHICYFWFSFCVLPLVWVFYPLWMIRRATRDLISQY